MKTQREYIFRGKSSVTYQWEEINLLDIASFVGRWYYATIGQYTGLKDKNGKKIFEGDILAFEQLDGKLVNCGVVKYGTFNCSCCDGVYGYYLSDGDIRYFDDPDAIPYVVIGNKWDNPELLEENND